MGLFDDMENDGCLKILIGAIVVICLFVWLGQKCS